MRVKTPVDFHTFAQLKIPFVFLALLLLAILGLSGAPIALPLQHVADHHPQQAQKEENGHQDESDVVWFGPTGSTVTFPSICSVICWRLKRRDKETNHFKYCYTETQSNGLSLQRPSWQPDIRSECEGALEARAEQLRGFKCQA